MEPLTLDTPHGPARAHLHLVGEPRAALVLGHGAGGGVAAPDLLAATAAANAAQISVALIEQPYRVAGRRSAAPARQLDAAWEAVVAQLRGEGSPGIAPSLEAAGAGMTAPFRDLPLLTGGRSSGARVACRTARATAARGVLCLAFPLVPPQREAARAAGRPAPPSRLPELEGAGVPVLVVQGERDRFGIPPVGDQRSIVLVRGDHALRGDRAAVTAAIGDWLVALLATVQR